MLVGMWRQYLTRRIGSRSVALRVGSRVLWECVWVTMGVLCLSLRFSSLMMGMAAALGTGLGTASGR